MISAQITRIDQSFDLASKEIQTFAVLELPDGTELKFHVDAEVSKKLMGLAGEPVEAPVPPKVAKVSARGLVKESHEPLPPPPPQEPEPEFTPEEADEVLTEADVELDWQLLPDDELQPRFKAALFKLKIPSRVKVSQLVALVQQIEERFTPNDWREVLGDVPQAEAPARPPPQPPPPAPQPQVGQVTWADGSIINPTATTRARTVPKDDLGYPIVDGDRDPGEVVAGHGADVDEDGVGQL